MKPEINGLTIEPSGSDCHLFRRVIEPRYTGKTIRQLLDQAIRLVPSYDHVVSPFRRRGRDADLSAGRGPRADCETITIAPADQGKEHAIRIVVAPGGGPVTGGPVTFRVGSTPGASDLIAQTTLDLGTHSLAFTPSSGSATIQIESTDAWNKYISQCSIESAGTVVLPTPFATGDLPNIRFEARRAGPFGQVPERPILSGFLALAV